MKKKIVLAIVIVILALIAGSCCATAYVLDGYWSTRNLQTTEKLMAQIDRYEGAYRRQTEQAGDKRNQHKRPIQQ